MWTDFTLTTKLSTSDTWLFSACLHPPLALLSLFTRVPARSFVQMFVSLPAVASAWRFEITVAIACSSPLNELETALPQAATPTAKRDVQSTARVRWIRTVMPAQRVRDRPPEGAMDAPTAGLERGSVLLVVAPEAQPCRDAIGRGHEVGAECVDHLLQRDHRAVGCQVDRGDHVAVLVSNGRGDRVQLRSELLVVDRETGGADLVELVVQRFLARDRVRPALGELHRGEQIALLGVGEVGQQQLAHRRAVGGQARAGLQVEVDPALSTAEAPHAVDVQDVRPIEHREADRVGGRSEERR